MKKTNNAFTLTELLVALGVIAILCAILLPVVFNMMPNQNTIMAKRAYYTTQSVVSEMINDEACYPDKTSAVTNPRIGFDDAAGNVNCAIWGDDKKSLTSMADAGKKFKTIFRDMLSLDGDADKFTTKDGMNWAFSDTSSFSSSGTGGFIYLTVDVNGKNKPNCASTTQAYATELGDGDNSACATVANGYDRFRMKIYGNGKIEVVESWAQEAVKVDRNITSDKNSNAED